MKAKFVSVLVALAICAPFRDAFGTSTLLSGFEGDLTSSVGVDWVTGLPHSFVSSGATQGVNALQLTHNTGWTQNFTLDSPALANLVALSDTFEVDTTTPDTTSWRQMFIVMQGDNQSWSQHQFDLVGKGTGTATLDLNATGIKANAAAGGKSWWQIYLIFQGGDDPATAQIQTTIDNVRFTSIPEPSSLALVALATAVVVVLPCRRNKGNG